MNSMLAEIEEIPDRVAQLLAQPTVALPLHVPYLGMGSSYFAPLAFNYMGVAIEPELASEYVAYIAPETTKPMGVILSQSGKSSEALWCRSLFDHYIAITNFPDHPLSQAANVAQTVPIWAGDEQHSSSKTYINTLLVLFRGFGLDATAAVKLLADRMKTYEAAGKELADTVFELLNRKRIHGMYVTGSGPNVATALEAALILSESTKLTFQGLPMAQYDHGPKETADNSLVIQIMARGRAYERTRKLSETIAAAGASVLTVEEPDAEERFSILHNIIPFNYMAYYLAQQLNRGETFSVGGKITEVI